ncbi:MULTISPECIES: hypothetical protein [unclassified Pseudoclavibacter]|uniref:hypothetical protein n=1 Tax=unclassified Pseudoclavibacter TaxID=2615177 RepID=UPI001BABBC6D|nr:hypothetical protein [Pseudoclavibacter sp. Marseille-Q4354]MBS3177233.1 hypothetical protein [Pseudoclavibacter sp. Marseille-Q4354]
MMNLLPELLGSVDPTALLVILTGLALILIALAAVIVLRVLFGRSGVPAKRVVAILRAIGDMLARVPRR